MCEILGTVIVIVIAIAIEGIEIVMIAGIGGMILVRGLVLREVTEEGTVTGIEMTTDAGIEIPVGLLRRGNTTLEDIDNDISSRSNPIHSSASAFPISGCLPLCLSSVLPLPLLCLPSVFLDQPHSLLSLVPPTLLSSDMSDANNLKVLFN